MNASDIAVTLTRPQASNQLVTTMPVPEENLLRSKDPAIQDSDDWPLYTLRKAKVRSKHTGELVSLLAAHDDHPVTVLGTVESVNSDLIENSIRLPENLSDLSDRFRLVKDEKYQSKTVQLDNITNYAFAEYDDGTYGFWAAGKAGWFELKEPVSAYKSVYEGMNEAASMFYLLADKLRRSYKTNWRLTTKGLDRYATTIFKDVRLC